MQGRQSLLPRNSAIRRAGVAATLLLVVASGAVETNIPAAADACPIDVGRSYGYTLQAAQTALAAVTDTCRTLMFTAGTYQFNGTFPITASSVTVTGEPGAVITATASVSLIDGLIKVSGSGVSLKDLALDGSGASTDGIFSSGPSTTITGTTVTNVTRRAISILSTAVDATISGCTVNGFGDRGVLTQAARTSVDGCTVTGGNGIGIWAYGKADHASFTNNTVSNSASMGIEFATATNFTASGNVLHDNHKLGIHMLRSNAGTVSNNISHHNGSNGIDAHGSTFVTISGNKSYFNGGPRTLDNPVEGQGILVYCSQNIKVLSNTVWNNAQSQPGDRNGIQVSDNGGQNGELPTRDITVDRNLSYDDQAPPTQGWAIRLGGNVTSVTPDLDYITVTNNRGYGNINAGLYTGGLAPNAHVTIANNSLGDGSTTVPDPPRNVSAAAGDASATVSWTAPASDGGSPITGYTATSTPAGGTTSLGAGATSVTVSGLTNGTSYTFTVTATNTAGTSAASSPSTAVSPQAPPVTAPDPPRNVTATAGDASATVSWTPPASDGSSAITGYTITSSAGAPTSAAAGDTSATVSGLTNGTSYTFTVTATNGVGTSLPSSPSTAVTPRPAATAPDPPRTVTATAGDASATVSWTAPASDGGSAITGYTVTPSSGPTTPAAAGATSVTVSGLTNGTSYTFTVTATNGVGTSLPSSPSTAVTPRPAATAPDPPRNVTATAGDASATVSWAAPAFNGGSAITGYTVTPSSGPTTTAAAGATSATVSGLINGTSYTFTVTATNTVGTSAASSPANAVTPQAPPATAPNPPTNVSAAAGDVSATVSWTAPASDGGSAITGYTVTSAPGNITAQTGSAARTATVSGLANGTGYTFTVTATNAVGTSAASNVSNSVTPRAAATAPDPPTNVSATAGDASATVSWTAPASDGGSAITGYTITPSSGPTTTVAAGATSVTVTGLTNGTSYTFTVTATNIVGTSAASNVSNSVTPRATATAVTTVQETAPAVSYNSWAGVTDAASSGGSYRISKTANATVSVKFTGSSIKWLMRKGPDRGQAAVTIDGVSRGTVDLYAANPSNGSQTYSGLTANAHTIVIKVLGTKRTSATAANVPVDGFLVGASTTPVQENSPSVAFDSWTEVVNASADGGSYRASATAGALAALTFTGTRVDWITARGPRYGKASVSVDGGKPVTVDLYSATSQWRVIGWSFTGLSSGSHTLTIKVLGVKNAASSGTKVLVDAVTIAPAATANPAALGSGASAAAPTYAGQRGTAGSGDGPGAGFPAGGTPGIGARGDRSP